jgi:hypothetical protein
MNARRLITLGRAPAVAALRGVCLEHIRLKDKNEETDLLDQ